MNANYVYRVSKFTYDEIAAKARRDLGVKRLPPEVSAEIEQAVAKHKSRARKRAKNDQAEPQPGRFLTLYRKRVAARVRELVHELYRRPSAKWAGGDVRVIVGFGEPYADGHVEVAWSKNGKWRGNDVVYEITIPDDWARTVGSVPGLADAGGMLTLAAEQIAPGLWRAAWAVQSRGFALRVEHGVILFRDGEWIHAADEAAALRIAERRAKMRAEQRAAEQARREELARLFDEAPHRWVMVAPASEIAERIGDLPITVEDSIRAGNCLPGTLNWLRARGFDGEQGKISELVQLAQGQLGDSVRAAIAVAVLRAQRRGNSPHAGG